MSELSPVNFLELPGTEETSAYGHMVAIFQLKNGIGGNKAVRFAFQNTLERKKMSFMLNTSTSAISDFSYTDYEHNSLGMLEEADQQLIIDVMSVYLGRIEAMVSRITKQMRQEWGRDYRTEAIERSGYCHYFSQQSQEIEKNFGLNIFSYTQSTISKKRAFPFRTR